MSNYLICTRRWPTKDQVTAADMTHSDISCGVAQLSELHRIKDARGLAASVLPNWADFCAIPYVLFSDADVCGNGERVSDLIEKNELGLCHEFGPENNPNSGNAIRLWVWQPDWEQMHKLKAKCLARKPKKKAPVKKRVVARKKSSG